MQGKVDTLPYKTFQKLKEKYVAKMILITGDSLTGQGLHLAFKNHREYVEHKFRQEGIEVYRHAHNYRSLDGKHPEMGVVYMVNDSEINPGVEAWVLIGHNARYITEQKQEPT